MVDDVTDASLQSDIEAVVVGWVEICDHWAEGLGSEGDELSHEIGEGLNSLNGVDAIGAAIAEKKDAEKTYEKLEVHSLEEINFIHLNLKLLLFIVELSLLIIPKDKKETNSTNPSDFNP